MKKLLSILFLFSVCAQAQITTSPVIPANPIFDRAYVGSGTGPLPSFTFTLDTNTGVWNSGADQLAFVTAGSSKMAFASSTIGMGSGQIFGWASNADPTLAGNDASMTRSAAGVVNFVNGVSSTPQALSGAGAVNLTTLTTSYTSSGVAQALTLANGTNGQIKVIVHVADGGSGVLTPTTASGFTTVTFTNVGETVTLQYFTTGGWVIIAIRGAVAA